MTLTILKLFNQIQSIVNYASIYSILLPVLVGLFFIRNLHEKGILILLLVVTGSIPQLIRGIFGQVNFIYLFYNINVPIEITILYLFFRNFFNSDIRRNVITLSYAFSLILGIFLSVAYSFRYHFFSEWVCLNNLFFTGWVLMLLIEIYERDDLIINTAVPLFWFVIGLFLYCSCTVLIFSLWPYIKSHQDTVLNNLWIIHDVFNIGMYVSFSVGFNLSAKNMSK